MQCCLSLWLLCSSAWAGPATASVGRAVLSGEAPFQSHPSIRVPTQMFQLQQPQRGATSDSTTHTHTLPAEYKRN